LPLEKIYERGEAPVAAKKAYEVPPAAVDADPPLGRVRKKLAASVDAQKVGGVPGDSRCWMAPCRGREKKKMAAHVDAHGGQGDHGGQRW
jgi:hypothetical protein